MTEPALRELTVTSTLPFVRASSEALRMNGRDRVASVLSEEIVLQAGLIFSPLRSPDDGLRQTFTALAEVSPEFPITTDNLLDLPFLTTGLVGAILTGETLAWGWISTVVVAVLPAPSEAVTVAVPPLSDRQVGVRPVTEFPS